MENIVTEHYSSPLKRVECISKKRLKIIMLIIIILGIAYFIYNKFIYNPCSSVITRWSQANKCYEQLKQKPDNVHGLRKIGIGEEESDEYLGLFGTLKEINDEYIVISTGGNNFVVYCDLSEIKIFKVINNKMVQMGFQDIEINNVMDLIILQSQNDNLFANSILIQG